MTIDERLDRLAERHEALTQSVEIMNHRMDELRTFIQQDSENIRALARIAEIHEHRISDIENGQD